MAIIINKKLEESKLVFNIEIPFFDYEKYIRESAEHLSERVNIPGFRKGKAPYDIVAKEVGEMAIYENALQDIIENAYDEFIKKTEIKEKIFYELDIQVAQLVPGNPIVFNIEYMLIPEITLGDYRNLKIKKSKIDTSSEEFKLKVNNAISELQDSKSIKKEMDKAIEIGDQATLNMDLFLDGVPLEDGSIKDYTQLIDPKIFIPGFVENLVGLKSGDKKEFELLFPDNYFDNKVAGKKILFKVEILKVYKVDKPELNDEFAKGFGFDKYDDLKKHIENNIRDEIEAKEIDKKTIEMINKIIQNSKISPIPDRLIDLETKKMIEELKDSLSQSGMDFERYKESINKTEEELKNEFRPKAEERLKMALIIDKISEVENIIVTEEEINKEIEDAKNYYKNHPDFENIKNNLEQPAYRQQLGRVLKNEKTIKFLREQNFID
ncbi:MAG TPA: trigger factor [bacterium]|nr:trigger factor [bacterium]